MNIIFPINGMDVVDVDTIVDVDGVDVRMLGRFGCVSSDFS